MGKELKIINILFCLLVMLISFGFNNGYGRPSKYYMHIYFTFRVRYRFTTTKHHYTNVRWGRRDRDRMMVVFRICTD
jgi:hypothetical protein